MRNEEYVDTSVHRVMAALNPWLSLTDLGRIYGISAIHCGRILEQQGWRDRRGRPTPAALEADAASCAGTHGQGRTVFWSRAICSELLESKGYAPMSRNVQIEQWTQLLEALQLGSPSISATPDQMAEEMPTELVDDVNQQLAVRGCSYRVSRHQRQASRSASAC